MVPSSVFTSNSHHAQAIISWPSTGPQDAQRLEKGSQFSLKCSLWGHLYVERSPKEENIVYQERIYQNISHQGQATISSELLCVHVCLCVHVWTCMHACVHKRCVQIYVCDCVFGCS